MFTFILEAFDNEFLRILKPPRCRQGLPGGTRLLLLSLLLPDTLLVTELRHRRSNKQTQIQTNRQTSKTFDKHTEAYGGHCTTDRRPQTLSDAWFIRTARQTTKSIKHAELGLKPATHDKRLRTVTDVLYCALLCCGAGYHGAGDPTPPPPPQLSSAKQCKAAKRCKAEEPTPPQVHPDGSDAEAPTSMVADASAVSDSSDAGKYAGRDAYFAEFHSHVLWSPPLLKPEVVLRAKQDGVELLGIADVTVDISQSDHMLRRISRKNHWTRLAIFVGLTFKKAELMITLKPMKCPVCSRHATKALELCMDGDVQNFSLCSENVSRMASAAREHEARLPRNIISNPCRTEINCSEINVATGGGPWMWLLLYLL